jgi:hypothetical protein
MPYIPQEDREAIAFGNAEPRTVGELNFAITALALAYMEQHGKSYATINEIIGVLECAKLEFYRRAAAPYEDQKITTNGDVYK